MNNPCFDEKTRKSCPDRHCGCAIKCERWAAYVAERDAEYERRYIENLGKTVANDAHYHRIQMVEKKNFEDRKYRSRRSR